MRVQFCGSSVACARNGASYSTSIASVTDCLEPDFSLTSPDEARLAFVRMGDLTHSACAIWIAVADGRDARELTPCTATDGFKMSWSPDARLLAVTAGATTVRSPSHIEVIDVASGHRRAVTQPPLAHSGDWSGVLA